MENTTLLTLYIEHDIQAPFRKLLKQKVQLSVTA